VEARNLISGNTESGMWIYNTPSPGNQVLGNFIGTDASGTVAVPNGLHGVEVSGSSSGSVIGEDSPGRSNLISGNVIDGVRIAGATSNVIMGNFIGTDISGTSALPNLARGVLFGGGASNNVVGGTTPEARNVIAANGTFGVSIVDSNSNEVLGNYIGTDVTGTLPLGNTFSGVIVQDSPGNTVGAPGAGNLISANGSIGIYILQPGSTGNQAQGNRIGTDVTGTVAMGNSSSGVQIRESAAGNLVGGTGPAARNVISANGSDGVKIYGANGNDILGNYIGTDVTGMAALGNSLSGVLVENGSNNRIGGTEDGAGNLISGGHGDGVVIVGSFSIGNEVLGNRIGTDATGAPTLGNQGAGGGIVDGRGNAVGGTAEGAANLIAGNRDEGWVILGQTANRNPILGNAMYDNGMLGIDLNWPDGVTLNDPGDADTGPNNLQNFPYLSSVAASPSGITIEGALDSTASTDFRIEFFTSTVCDDSGYGEGERFLGHTDVTTNALGDAVYNVTLPAPVSDGDSIATTATDSAGNTSELCGCVTVNCSVTVGLGVPLVAQDPDTWVWGSPEDVRFAKGDLAAVSTYVTTADGTLFASSSLDMSMDAPGAGDGLYYVVRPLGCGSWQTGPGAEPGRDAALP
jgi:hypothetical protein